MANNLEISMVKKATNFFIDVLQNMPPGNQMGTHHLKLFQNLMKNGDNDVKKYFKSFTESTKYRFFQNGSEFFIIAAGYVSLKPLWKTKNRSHQQSVKAEKSLAINMQNVYASLPPDIDLDTDFVDSFAVDKKSKEKRVIEFCVDYLHNYGETHYLKLISCVKQSDSDIKDFFVPFKDSDTFWFFKTYPDIFELETDGFLSLPAHDGDEAFTFKSLDEKVIELLVLKLEKNGEIHYEKLVQYIEGFSAEIKHYFSMFSTADKYHFFREHSTKFLIQDNGYVSLSWNTEKNQALIPSNLLQQTAKGDSITEGYVEVGKRNDQKTRTSISKELEKKIVSSFIKILEISGTMHFENLFKSVEQSSPELKNFLSNFCGSERYMFFKVLHQIFLIGSNGFVSLKPKNSLNYQTSDSESLSVVMEACDVTLSIIKQFIFLYLQIYDSLHYAKLLRCLNMLHPSVRNLLGTDESSDEISFFEKHCNEFSISKDNSVLLPSETESLQNTLNKNAAYDKVVCILVHSLEKSGPIHYEKLFKCAEESSGETKDYLDHFSLSGKYCFLKVHPSCFTLTDSCCVAFTDSFKENQFSGEAESELPEVKQYFISHLLDSSMVHYEQLAKNLKESDTNIKDFFANCTLSDILDFFKEYPTMFCVGNNGYISLKLQPGCILNGESTTTSETITIVEKVVRFLALNLKQSGPIHYEKLIKRLKGSSPSIKDFFTNFSQDDIVWFFKERPSEFSIQDDGYVTVPLKTESNITAGVTRELTLKQIEDKVTKLLVDHLKNTGRTHYEKLVKCVINHSSHDVKYFFSQYSLSDVFRFFKEKPSEFFIEKDGYIYLPIEMLPAADTNTVAPSESEINEIKVIDFCIVNLKCFGSMHYENLAKRLHASTSDIRYFFQGYSSSDIFNFFNFFPEIFTVNSTNVVSLVEQQIKTDVQSSSHSVNEEAIIIDILVNHLKNYHSVHFQKLCKTSERTTNFFKHFSISKQFKFFKQQDKYFMLGNDGYVELIGSEHPAELEDIDTALEKLFIRTLKGKKKSYKSLRYIAMAADESFKYILKDVSPIEIYEFLKARPHHFVFEDDRNVYLNPQKHKGNSYIVLKASKKPNISSSYNAASSLHEKNHCVTGLVECGKDSAKDSNVRPIIVTSQNSNTEDSSHIINRDNYDICQQEKVVESCKNFKDYFTEGNERVITENSQNRLLENAEFLNAENEIKSVKIPSESDKCSVSSCTTNAASSLHEENHCVTSLVECRDDSVRDNNVRSILITSENSNVEDSYQMINRDNYDICQQQEKVVDACKNIKDSFTEGNKREVTENSQNCLLKNAEFPKAENEIKSVEISSESNKCSVSCNVESIHSNTKEPIPLELTSCFVPDKDGFVFHNNSEEVYPAEKEAVTFFLDKLFSSTEPIYYKSLFLQLQCSELYKISSISNVFSTYGSEDHINFFKKYKDHFYVDSNDFISLQIQTVLLEQHNGYSVVDENCEIKNIAVGEKKSAISKCKLEEKKASSPNLVFGLTDMHVTAIKYIISILKLKKSMHYSKLLEEACNDDEYMAMFFSTFILSDVQKFLQMHSMYFIIDSEGMMTLKDLKIDLSNVLTFHQDIYQVIHFMETEALKFFITILRDKPKKGFELEECICLAPGYVVSFFVANYYDTNFMNFFLDHLDYFDVDENKCVTLTSTALNINVEKISETETSIWLQMNGKTNMEENTSTVQAETVNESKCSSSCDEKVSDSYSQCNTTFDKNLHPSESPCNLPKVIFQNKTTFASLLRGYTIPILSDSLKDVPESLGVSSSPTSSIGNSSFDKQQLHSTIRKAVVKTNEDECSATSTTMSNTNSHDYCSNKPKENKQSEQVFLQSRVQHTFATETSDSEHTIDRDNVRKNSNAAACNLKSLSQMHKTAIQIMIEVLKVEKCMYYGDLSKEVQNKDQTMSMFFSTLNLSDVQKFLQIHFMYFCIDSNGMTTLKDHGITLKEVLTLPQDVIPVVRSIEAEAVKFYTCILKNKLKMESVELESCLASAPGYVIFYFVENYCDYNFLQFFFNHSDCFSVDDKKYVTLTAEGLAKDCSVLCESISGTTIATNQNISQNISDSSTHFKHTQSQNSAFMNDKYNTDSITFTLLNSKKINEANVECMTTVSQSHSSSTAPTLVNSFFNTERQLLMDKVNLRSYDDESSVTSNVSSEIHMNLKKPITKNIPFGVMQNRMDEKFTSLLTNACTELRLARHTLNDFLTFQCKINLEGQTMGNCNSVLKTKLRSISENFNPETEQKCVDFFCEILKNKTYPVSISALKSLISQAPSDVKTYLTNYCTNQDLSIFFHMNLEYFLINSCDYVSLRAKCEEHNRPCASDNEHLKLKALNFYVTILSEASHGVSCRKLQKCLSDASAEVQEFMFTNYNQNFIQFFKNYSEWFSVNEIGRVFLQNVKCNI